MHCKLNATFAEGRVLKQAVIILLASGTLNLGAMPNKFAHRGPAQSVWVADWTTLDRRPIRKGQSA